MDNVSFLSAQWRHYKYHKLVVEIRAKLRKNINKYFFETKI